MATVPERDGARPAPVGGDQDGRQRRTGDVDVAKREEAMGGPDDHTSADPSSSTVVPRRRRWRAGRTLRDGRRLYWWVELLAAGVFYEVYSFVRNLHHST